MRLVACALIAASPLVVRAQETNPTQVNVQPGNSGNSTPIFRVTVVSRNIQAVSYRHRSGWTKVDFKGTDIAPQAKGTAEVNGSLGHAQIKLDVKDLPSPQTFGRQFLTYVLWAITPDGKPQNLSEVVVNSHGDYKSDGISTDLQAFGLIITAEPYFAVSTPSDVVVMENVIRPDTIGKDEEVNAKYELLPRGTYTYHVPEAQQKTVDLNSNKKNPLEIYEAMNAIYIDQYARADQFASDEYQDAEKLLSQAENYQQRKQWKPAIMTAREAVQKAEDARLVSLRRQEQLAQDQQRQEAAAREAAAKARAEEEAQRAALAAQQRQEAEEHARQEAEARRQAEQAKEEADAARAQAATEAQRAQQAAAEADRLRNQAVADKEQLRAQLLQQFNQIMPCTETPRGLVINMSDVLFDFNKYTLKEATREQLAKLSGIILSHPGLNLRVEGYTDNIGTEEYNQKLSEKRASTVRQYLITQGINPDTTTAIGYGEQYPVASNDTASGRAMNRRVQIVVSGEVIGVKIGVPPTQQNQTPGTPGFPAPAAPANPGVQPQTNPAPTAPPQQQ